MGAHVSSAAAKRLWFLAASLLLVPATLLALTDGAGRWVALGIVIAVSVIIAGAVVASIRQLVRDALSSRHDPLTGLPNVSTLTAAAGLGRPNGAMLFLDLDGFDAVNDRIGHEQADTLLLSVAELLKGFAGRADVLARIGGDEFALLLTRESPAQAIATAERIRRLVSDMRFTARDHITGLGVSIGIAPADGVAGGHELLRRAHAACRSAKARGRNRVELYRPVLSEQSRFSADAEWTVKVKDALQQDRMHIVFQPIMDIESNRIAHHEALVRITTTDGETIAADAFVASAERCGLIRDIDRFVVAAALRQVAAEATVGGVMHVAINLSGLSLDEEAVIDIRQAIIESGVDPATITFEITETSAIANLTQTRRAIETLRTMGCRFALDDFGKGMSSFAYLRYLPVDFLKIDGTFVRNLHEDVVNQAMVRSMNELAHSLGMRTIAECVEDDGSLRTLASLGTDLAQGYFVGRPAARPARDTVILPTSQPPERDNAVHVRLPVGNAEEIIELVRFLDALDMRSRDLRDTGQLAADKLTLPDEFDRLVAELVGAMHEQAAAAAAVGATILDITIPSDPMLPKLIAWSEPRFDVMYELARTGVVQAEWERPMRLLGQIFHAVRAQVCAPGRV